MIIAKFGTSFDTQYLLPYNGSTYSAQISSLGLPAYWQTWNTDETYVTETYEIGSVEILYNEVRTAITKVNYLSECLTITNSFYFDVATQTIYIHFEQDVNPMSASTITLYEITGYTNGHTVYISDQEYAPYLLSIPSISKSVDPLKSNKMSFSSQTITLDNSTGEQDKFIDEPIPGITFELVDYNEDTGEQTNIYTGYVSADSYGLNQTEFTITDIRQSDNIECPTDTIYDYLTDNGESTAYLSDTNAAQIVPNVYGTVTGVPCFCLNSEETSPTYYYFMPCHYITSISAVYADIDDAWTSVTPTEYNYDLGIFRLNASDCTDDNNKLVSVKATLTGINISDPADIIIDLNSRFLGKDFNTSYYDITEWNAEAAKIGGSCYLYMDESAELFEWIEQLQNVGIRQFVYDITPDGRRTIRTYDPTRDVSVVIENWQLLDGYSGERDFEYYASSVTVEYANDFTDDIASSVTNTDYQDERIRKYKQDVNYTASLDNAGLDNETDATNKAANIAEKYEPRIIFSLDIYNDDASLFSELNLFSIIYINFDDAQIGREFFGERFAIVEEIDIDLNENTINIVARNLNYDIIISSDGDIITSIYGDYLATIGD